MSLPTDPYILLSYVNLKLRDYFDSLEDFCASDHLSEVAIKEALGNLDYYYDEENNQFKRSLTDVPR